MLPILRPLSKKWKEIGEALQLRDEFLREEFTNMATDEDCLVKVVSSWVKHHEPSWEKLAAALRVVGENETALKCNKKSKITKYRDVYFPRVAQWLKIWFIYRDILSLFLPLHVYS